MAYIFTQRESETQTRPRILCNAPFKIKLGT